MTDRDLVNILGHLDQEWELLAVTPFEIAELRSLGYVERAGLRLTAAGREKLAALRGQR